MKSCSGLSDFSTSSKSATKNALCRRETFIIGLGYGLSNDWLSLLRDCSADALHV